MKKFILCFLFLNFGCAEPTYLKEAGDSGGGSAEKVERACQISFNASDLCLTWWWDGDKPKSSVDGRLYFKIYRLNIIDQSQVLLDLERLEVVLWMPDMGHGSVPVTITRKDLGTYEASPVHFIMPGEWEIRFKGTEGGEVLGEANVGITIF